jgi:acetolactate synthase-1/2/3 large subunit
MTKASEQICDVLIEAGIEHVFGMPGGGASVIWNSLTNRQDKINTVLVRHEQAASCMADMYGRLTGKPAVLIGQGPFIGSSGTFGILEAFLSCSPMLVLTDTSDANTFSQHGNYQSGTGEHGSYDLPGMLRAASKYVTYAVTPEEAVQGVQLAIKQATSGRPGPACVVMRTAAIAGEVNPESIPKIYPTERYLRSSLTTPLRIELEKAAELLIKANYPVLIAGNGVHVSKAYTELRQLAELLGMPVATSYKGKSTFPETHPLAVGMMGTYGHKLANNVIADADVLLVAGSELSPDNTLYESTKLIDPSRQMIIQIDVDPRNAGWTYPVEMALIGDLKPALQGLLEVLEERGGKGLPLAEKRTTVLGKRKQAEGFFDTPEMYSTVSPILPQRLVKELNKAVSPSTILTLDAGNNRLWMSHFFQSKEVGTVFGPGGIGGMGWGVAAALAAKLVCPEKPVVSVAGDGGFAMMLNVLSTATQYQLPLTFVVMNNSGLGMVRDLRPQIKSGSLTFATTDYAKIASAFGCRGVRVGKPEELAPTLKEAMSAKEPMVVDVVISDKESILKIRQT